MAAATAEYYFGFVFVDVTVFRMLKSISKPNFVEYLNRRHRYNYFRFETQTSAILKFYLRFRSPPVRRNLHVTLHQATEFRPSQAPTTEIWRHIHFPRWRPRPLHTTFGIVYLLMSLPSEGKSLLANQILLIYLNWRLIYSYFRFRNTNVRHIGFRSRPVCRNMHVILHQATEFRPIRSTHCGNMYYPFLKMAAVTAKYYFRFRICWSHCL